MVDIRHDVYWIHTISAITTFKFNDVIFTIKNQWNETYFTLSISLKTFLLIIYQLQYYQSVLWKWCVVILYCLRLIQTIGKKCIRKAAFLSWHLFVEICHVKIKYYKLISLLRRYGKNCSSTRVLFSFSYYYNMYYHQF